MNLSPNIIAMCQLVSFIKSEQNIALNKKFHPVNYAKKVLKRFQKIEPNAILILGDNVPKNCYSYVQCSIDNKWTFVTHKPPISIVASTDGKIDLDEGTAESIFNFVND